MTYPIEEQIQQLQNGDRNAAWSAIEALTRIGIPAVEALIRALGDASETVRWRAARALGKIGDVRAVEPLIALLLDESEKVRQGATIALCYMGDENTLPRKVLAQAGLLVEQRIHIIEALRKVKYTDEYRTLRYFLPDIETFVEQMLQDADLAVREGALFISAWLQGETLLRPTQAPLSLPVELLRPAVNHTETNPEELLRVVEEGENKVTE
jgi:HEAT repeat protein